MGNLPNIKMKHSKMVHSHSHSIGFGIVSSRASFKEVKNNNSNDMKEAAKFKKLGLPSSNFIQLNKIYFIDLYLVMKNYHLLLAKERLSRRGQIIPKVFQFTSVNILHT
jgi:hypothetical protein